MIFARVTSPFLATRVLRQLSIDKRECFPVASDVLDEDNNTLSGTDNKEELLN